jgi:hypothetical protein
MAITNGPMVGKAQKVTWKGTGSHVFVDGVESIGFARKGETKETTCALTTQDLADKTYIGTLRDGTASIKLKYVNFGDATQDDMFDRVGQTTPVETILYLDAATKVTFNAIVTDFSVDDAIDGIASGSISLQISGAITPAAV